MHGMINIRGNVQGFDKIAQRTGDRMWSMENVLRFYRRVENYKGLFDPGRNEALQVAIFQHNVIFFQILISF